MIDLSRLSALRRKMEDLSLRNQVLRAEAEQNARSLAGALDGTRLLVRTLRARREAVHSFV
jgi:hypothetical protein